MSVAGSQEDSKLADELTPFFSNKQKYKRRMG